MENMNQKVYINPNFNRTGTHFNKHFCQLSSNTVQQNKRKIFVNPNFIPMKEHHSANFQQVPPKTPDCNPSVNIFYNYPQNFNPLVNGIPNNRQSHLTSTFTTSNVCKNQIIREEIKRYDRGPNVQNNLQCQRIDTRNNYNEPKIPKSKYSLVRNTNLVRIPIKPEVRQVVNLKPEISSTCNIFSKNNTVPEKKSRYCIVRNNTNIIQCNNDTSVTCKSIVKSNTIKISKYKTTTVNNLKKELQTVKDIKNKISYEPKPRNLLVNNKSFNSPLLKVSLKQNKYSYKKVNGNRKRVKADLKDMKLNSSVNRSILYKRTKNKTSKYKINNIPCPLYVKYGKCLRKSNGICEYLHDKKHVSLCRKFIKGICHDTNCLLSHELSAKKMPTCYFYLKGMCTKENCPYLHVKLSSKTKICQDFLKGYCEKGEKCSERHIYQISPLKVKRLQKDKQTKISPKIQKILNRSRNKRPKQKEDNISSQHSETDQRYFKDTMNDNEKCETIKPLRCKLGTLPSYIQLL